MTPRLDKQTALIRVPLQTYQQHPRDREHGAGALQAGQALAEQDHSDQHHHQRVEAAEGGDQRVGRGHGAEADQEERRKVEQSGDDDKRRHRPQRHARLAVGEQEQRLHRHPAHAHANGGPEGAEAGSIRGEVNQDEEPAVGQGSANGERQRAAVSGRGSVSRIFRDWRLLHGGDDDAPDNGDDTVIGATSEIAPAAMAW
jgi:hypothetical protein